VEAQPLPEIILDTRLRWRMLHHLSLKPTDSIARSYIEARSGDTDHLSNRGSE
jgi:hypothetical protein